MMKWDKYLAILTGALIVSATSVNAKPNDIRFELKREIIKTVHVATGCVSAVEYDDGVFVEAFITDPQCLPSGVSKRFIPASYRDFLPSNPLPSPITGQ